MKKLIRSVLVVAPLAMFLTPFSSVAHEAGDIILRVGATNVAPDESSSLISTAATGALGATSVGVGDNTQLGLNLVYLVSDNIGLEVLAATPFEHDLSAAGLGAYGFNATDLGETKQLPPTLSALYFFGNSSSTIRPYLGIGANYTTFFSKELSSSAKSVLGASSLDLDDSYGLAGRAGIDIDLPGNWLLNASVWTIDIDTDASFSSALGKVKADVEIDPWVYMISIGYKF